MTYFTQAALVGAAVLVLLGVGLFKHFNQKYGWSVTLCLMVGEQVGDWILRLVFLGVLMLAAGVLQALGAVLPPEVEQFIPSMWQSLIVTVVSAGTYWLAPTSKRTEP